MTASGMFCIFPRQSNQVTAKPLKRRTINNRLSQVSPDGPLATVLIHPGFSIGRNLLPHTLHLYFYLLRTFHDLYDVCLLCSLVLWQR